MILTDREIRAAIASRQVVIDPPPRSKAYSSTSVDLTLAPTVQLWLSKDRIVSPAEIGYDYWRDAEDFTRRFDLGDEGYVLEPGAFVLGWTAETIDLPLASRLAARVEGKSLLARLGIAVHVTASTIHAGFSGQIQLEFCNHGGLSVRILPAMRICQLILEQTLGTPEQGYSGTFAAQKAG